MAELPKGIGSLHQARLVLHSTLYRPPFYLPGEKYSEKLPPIKPEQLESEFTVQVNRGNDWYEGEVSVTEEVKAAARMQLPPEIKTNFEAELLPTRLASQRIEVGKVSLRLSVFLCWERGGGPTPAPGHYGTEGAGLDTRLTEVTWKPFLYVELLPYVEVELIKVW